MPLAPYFRSFQIANYRGFENFRIEKFGRLNLIGGLNGAGKTTLLEAMFVFVDQAGPLSFARPLIFRQLPASLAAAAGPFFRERGKPVVFEAETRDRKAAVRFTWGPQALQGSVPIPTKGAAEADTAGQTMGLAIESIQDSEVTLRRAAVVVGDAVTIHDSLNKVHPLPSAVILGRATLTNPTDLATRFTDAVQNGRKGAVVGLAKLIEPQIQDLQLLQIGTLTVLHAELPGGVLLPLSYVGEGVQTMLAIGLALMASPGGVVFIDEFEAAIHYTRLQEVWHQIGVLASEYGVQVFAATHSRENIDAAVRSVAARKKQQELCYFRLDRVSNHVVATRFDFPRLETAEAEDWELR